MLLASVNFAGRTSMEVGVKVLCEHRRSGDREHIASAYMTFVSLDPESCRPCQVPILVPQSEDEKRRYEAARQRRRNASSAASPEPWPQSARKLPSRLPPPRQTAIVPRRSCLKASPTSP